MVSAGSGIIQIASKPLNQFRTWPQCRISVSKPNTPKVDASSAAGYKWSLFQIRKNNRNYTRWQREKAMKYGLGVLLFIGMVGAAQVTLAATPCVSLAALKLPNTTITLAEERAGGTFTPPGASTTATPNPALSSLPGFCRITATLNPTNDSDIKIEVWLPASNWNGKL